MKPKEKAQELINKLYFDTSLTDIDEVKECALIVVKEIDFELRKNLAPNLTKKFWLEVKQALINHN
jgi:hypothetical protein